MVKNSRDLLNNNVKILNTTETTEAYFKIVEMGSFVLCVFVHHNLEFFKWGKRNK
jgi:hypothetical protein